MNDRDNDNKKRLLPVICGGAAALAVLMTVFAVLIPGCARRPAAHNVHSSGPTDSEVDLIPVDGDDQNEDQNEDQEDQKWTASASGTGKLFELTLKPGTGYSIEPKDDYQFVLKSEELGAITVIVEGLNYESGFEELIGFFGQKEPEKLMVGKRSKAIIAVYDETSTEAVFKLSDEDCLTVLGPDLETITAFLNNVMIRFDGEVFAAVDPDEEYEIREYEPRYEKATEKNDN